MTYSTIALADFARQLQCDAVSLCIDVRNPNEFASCHCRGSLNLPLPDIDAAQVQKLVADAGLDDHAIVYFICAAGRRSQMAAEKVAGELVNPICIVTGGGVGDLNPNLHGS